MTDQGSVALLDISDGIAQLTLNRPSRMNAFDAALHQAVRDALDVIEGTNGVGALILTGAGRGFSAGQDLEERASAFARGDDVDLAASISTNYNPLVQRLSALPFPVIAAVNGFASGAGAAIAVGCDIVLAARSARFQFSFVHVGLGPDCGTSWLLPRLVGQARALGLALIGDPVDADEAASIGLIWKAVDDEDLLHEARRIATAFVKGPRQAISSIKRQLRANRLTLDECLKFESQEQGRLGRQTDYREAVTAFVARRSPEFERE